MANAAPPFPPRRSTAPDNGLAVASLTLGILAIITSPCLLGGVLGIIGIVTGVVHLSSSANARTMAFIGSVFSLVGLGAACASVVLWYQFVPMLREMAATQMTREHDFSEWVGVRAPEMTVTPTDGKRIALSELKGRRVIVEVFQSDDPDCEAQFANMKTLDEETDDSSVFILGITRPDQPRVVEFVTRTGVKHPYAITNDLPRPFSEVEWLPTTFFIDSNGIIDAVNVNTISLEQLRKLASAKGYEGTPLDAPREAKSELTLAIPQLNLSQVWNTAIDNAQAVCVGDWNGDQQDDLLVCDGTPTLHLLDATGAEMSVVPLPSQFSSSAILEFGRHKAHGARLLECAGFEPDIAVADAHGKLAWTYKSSFGIDGAHFGDLDGDGSDEVIVGMNGFGGVHAVDANGQEIWISRIVGNVWSQVVISARGQQPARIFVTEAGGQIIEFDSKGNKVHAFASKGRYFTTIAAGRIDASNDVIVVALADTVRSGNARVVAFDGRGVERWSSPSTLTMSAMRDQVFALGDVDADGVTDVLIRDGDEISIVSPEGAKKASLVEKDIGQFCVLPRASATPLLITMSANKITAYKAESQAVTPAENEGAQP